ncbi:hypothetical protein Prede_1032 [Prevotella dentalis DSM 3688]|uniref:Glycoside hydrolase family 127 protein n=1 Tax=Prevotella dentalis (strain ATCC 49559 / DSM 3688 / JCM 13448 / NCTC 12043 / ES 2772) TaxID=908937 RepID=F9D224_PREDD|nr:beta-L-arabinofuranosidase domain-containing protein [Prevotella dentalis]AGB28369.1 hypothetical protein Prede_1032 [Prevotella dentalis DSM 3688]EGQ15842.1 hypothetical protein HMPREF9136_0902 [Prevotella dentalis DSM 3688]
MNNKSIKSTLITAGLAVGLAVFSQSTQKIGLVEQPIKVADVQNVQGFFGQRIALNRNTYLKNFPINKYVDFIANRQQMEWDWTRAEQHGKWLESAYLSAIQSGDKELLDKAKKVLHRIIGSQESDGYLGATAKSYRSPQRPIRGMDPYELYFVFHAFETIYEETGDKEALKAVEKLAEYFLTYFGPGKLEFWPSKTLRAPENRHQTLNGQSDFAGHSVHYSWEGTLLCDPIARLYTITGKKRYLDWAKWVVGNIDKWSGWDAFSRLDSIADGKLGVDQLQPYVHAHTFQMNFMGFLRLYQITGDRSLLRKVEGAWNDIYRRQMYITGGVSVAEHYEKGYVKPLSGNIIETCATMSWMQLTQMLLELTGDTKYADAIEKIMLNHVFAAQDALSGTCRYHTAPNGFKPDGYFHGPDCCTASGHRIISLLPTFFYAEKGKSFYINQLLPANYRGKAIDFNISGNYPVSDSVVIDVNRMQGNKLFIRVPAWCDNPSITVNGKPQGNVAAGKYYVVNKKWSKGDRIVMHLPMKEQWVKREHHADYEKYYLKDGEIMYREKPTKNIPYAFTRGPVVYCVDMVWNKQLSNDDVDINRNITVDTSVLPRPIDLPSNNVLAPFYETKATCMGRNVTITLSPFCNIGQWWRNGEDKPSQWSNAFSYAIWLTGK